MAYPGDLNRLNTWLSNGQQAVRTSPKAGSITLITWAINNGYDYAPDRPAHTIGIIRKPEDRWHSAIHNFLSHGGHRVWREGNSARGAFSATDNPTDVLYDMIAMGTVPAPIFWPQHVWVGDVDELVRLDDLGERFGITEQLNQRKTAAIDPGLAELVEEAWGWFGPLYSYDEQLYWSAGC